MNRREALSRVGILLGGAIIGAEAFLSGCKAIGSKDITLTVADIALLDEVGEIIIPATAGSPGAKAAQIGEFMKAIVTDCYAEQEQKVFTNGIKQLQDSCKATYKKEFKNLSVSERTAFLVALDKEAAEFVKTEEFKKQKDAFNKRQAEWVKAEQAKGNFGAEKMRENFPPHYFSMIKQLTLLGYFSSKIGATQALRYVETPGKFDGAYPYKRGDKAWAV